MWETYISININNFQESYNDAQSVKDESISLFNHGIIDLYTKAKIEYLFWQIHKKLQKILRQIEYIPEEFKNIDKKLNFIYYCNFSIFQSIPDSWALAHLFPIMPLHRLNEKPTKKASIVDLTCDSDGKIDKFINFQNVRYTLPLHTFNNKPYYLGIFLLGAYQEILGDLHNLFGDTNAVHISISIYLYTILKMFKYCFSLLI